MNPQEIKTLIEAGLGDATVTVTGEDGVHFSAIIISEAFLNKSRIQRQQLVYATLGQRIADGTIHALTMKTYTSEEWQQQSRAQHG